MARDPSKAPQRRPQKDDIVKASPAHKVGTRNEGGRRPMRRNTPALGNRSTKTRGKSKR
jgi:hypothetical protein